MSTVSYLRTAARWRRQALACAAVWLLVAQPAPSWAAPRAASARAPYALTGQVVSVADGDTLTLLVGRTRERVRLASIDAPETGHGRKRPGQPFGQAARKALADHVAGGAFVLQCYERDRYGRHICDVPLEDGDTVSRKLVAAGMAWANLQGGGKYLRDPLLPGLQARAQADRMGLWVRDDAVAPWVWRRECWAAIESGKTTPIC